MTTRLEGTLKREITIDGAPYTLSIGTAGLKLVPKGRRKGYELEWSALVSGDAALAAALNATMASAPLPAQLTTKAKPRKAPVKGGRK
jgi:hypothetical protein